MWADHDVARFEIAIQRLCTALGYPADVLLGLHDVEADMAPPPPSDPPAVRRLLRELRHARANTRRVVKRLLAEMEKRWI